MQTTIHALRQTLTLLGRDWRWRWAVLAGMALIITGLEAIGATLIYTLLGLVAAPEAAITLPLIGDIAGWFPASDRQTLLIWLAAVVGGFFVLRAIAVIAQTYVESRMIYNAGERLASHLVRGYLSLPYLVHTQHNSAELVRNTFDSVQTLVRQTLKPLVAILSKTMMVVGLTIVVALVTPSATLLAVLVLAPTVWLLMRVIQPRLKHLGRRTQEAKRESLKAVQQALGGVRDIKFLRRERYFADAFAHERRKLARANYLKATMSAAPPALIETTMVLVIVALFTVAILTGQGLGGALTTLGLFAYAGFRLQPNLRVIVQSLNDLRFGSAVLDDLSADRARVDVALDAERQRRREQPRHRQFMRHIELRDVSFAYHPEAPAVLERVNLRIRKGEHLGICGPTGGGKSTLVDLLAGLVSPSSGKILIDGQPLGPEPHWWQDQLGVVSQNVFLIDDTLRRNIAFGLRDDQVDDQLLRHAVERAQLRDVVEQLPEGLDTVVGERGIRLSGGQRQRVAVARALYRQPGVVVFDEGTSALDGATEGALMSSLDELRQDRTLIMVAHRITTVRDADRILVIDQGRVVAQGTYAELLRSCPLFQELLQQSPRLAEPAVVQEGA